MRVMVAIIVGTTAVWLTGCAMDQTVPPAATDPSAPRSAAIVQAAAAETAEPAGEAIEVLHLGQALEWALERHPGLKAASYKLEAERAASRQAVLLPNPALVSEVEEVGGSGGYSGTDAMATRLGVEQEVQLGGKRRAQRRFSELAVQRTWLERCAAAAGLEHTVRTRFAEVLYQQDLAGLLQEHLRLAEESHSAMEQRHASGDVSAIELTKSASELTAARLALARTQRDLESSRYALAAAWGEDLPRFDRAAADPGQPGVELPLDADALLAGLEASLGLEALRATVALAEWELALAKAEAWPNADVAGGVQHFNESDDHAFFVELSLPMPFFDRNQGGIDAARAGVRQAEQEFEQALLERRTELLNAAMQLRSLREELRAMEQELLPAAEAAFAAVNRGFEVGMQGYIDVLEARRGLLEAQRAHSALLLEERVLLAGLEHLLVPAPPADAAVVDGN